MNFPEAPLAVDNVESAPRGPQGFRAWLRTVRGKISIKWEPLQPVIFRRPTAEPVDSAGGDPAKPYERPL